MLSKSRNYMDHELIGVWIIDRYKIHARLNETAYERYSAG
ncbi:hypothetical protein M527_29075 [Sphingobium indicum IP26]|nr:hypothetical protein M527_29075 [Sphingobium indicum IP26]